MKIRSASIHDFLGISEGTLDLRRAVNFVFGDNGSGKSSIAEGPRYLFTQTARGTDAAGRGAVQLIRDGADRARLDLWATHEGAEFKLESVISAKGVAFAFTRDGEPFTGKAAQAGLASLLGPPELLRCLTDCGRVLEMSAKEQSELLSGLLGEGCTPDALKEKAEDILSPEAVATLIEGVCGRLPKGGLVTPAILKDAYEGAYKARTEANAALKALRAAPVAAPLVDAPIPSEAEIQAARDAVEAAENAGFDLRTQQGAAKEAARAQGALIEEEKRLRAQLDALPKPEAGEAVQLELGAGPTIEQLSQALKDAEVAEREYRHEAEEARTAATDMEREVGRLIEAQQGKAMQCDGTIGKGHACPLAPAPRKVTEREISAAQKRLGDANAAMVKVNTHRSNAILATEAARKALATAKEAAAKSAGASEAQRDALTDQLERLAIQIEECGEPMDRFRELDQAILDNGRTKAEAQRVLDAKLYVGEQRKAWSVYATALKDAEEEAALLDAVVKALEPRALPLSILSESIGPFVEQVNRTLTQIAPYSIAIDTEDGLSLRVIPAGGGKPRSPALLSESERLRVGAALSLALAKVSGLGFCVLDRLDALTQENRSRFVATVEQLGLESVIVLGSYERPPFEGDETTGVYWVEGGLVNAHEAQEVGA